jgi:hypothetical protein
MVEDAYADVLEDTFSELTGRVSMDSVKLLLGVDTARMSLTDTRRIKAVMAGLGWDHGTYRLHDPGRFEKGPRERVSRVAARKSAKSSKSPGGPTGASWWSTASTGSTARNLRFDREGILCNVP